MAISHPTLWATVRVLTASYVIYGGLVWFRTRPDACGAQVVSGLAQDVERAIARGVQARTLACDKLVRETREEAQRRLQGGALPSAVFLGGCLLSPPIFHGGKIRNSFCN